MKYTSINTCNVMTILSKTKSTLMTNYSRRTSNKSNYQNVLCKLVWNYCHSVYKTKQP